MLGDGKGIGGSMATGMKAGPMEPDEDDEGGLEAAAQELLDAQAAGDAAGVASAFKAMHAICNTYDSSSELG